VIAVLSLGTTIYASTVSDPPRNVIAKQATCQWADTVTWTAPDTDGGSVVTSYQVTDILDTTLHCTTSGLICVLNVDEEPTTVIDNPDPSVGAAYTVTAYNSIGKSKPSSVSDTVIVEVSPSSQPNPPTGVTAIAGNSQATVSWAASTPAYCSLGEVLYQVFTPTNSNAVCTTTSLTCTATGLTNGVPYSFSVSSQANNAYYPFYGPLYYFSENSQPSDTVIPSSVNSLNNIFSIKTHPFAIQSIGSFLILSLPPISTNAKISIVNLFGREVLSQNVASGVREISLNTKGNSISPGLYIIRLTQSNQGHRSNLIADEKVLLRQ